MNAANRLAGFAKEAGVPPSKVPVQGGGINLELVGDRQVEDALALLEGDFSLEPSWPWPVLTDLVGPPLAGELWFIGARPGCGKTTFLMNALQTYITEQRPSLYVGMEMNPERLRLQWAAWACGLEFSKVARKQWSLLPLDARTRLREHIQWQKTPEVSRLVTFADDERVTLTSLRRWMDACEKLGLQTVIVDHLHRMSWGSTDVTSRMAEGVVQLKTEAKERGIRMLVAAQLRRRQGGDVLDDYMPPSASEIKQTGATEQEADSILLLYRGLKPGLTNGDIAKVRQGMIDVAQLAEDRVMRVRVGKCRLDGDARDQSVSLFLHNGVLYGSDEDRELAKLGERYEL